MPLYQKSGYTLLSTLSTSSGTSWDTATISSCYNFLVEILGISGAADCILRMRLSANGGTNWSGYGNLTSTFFGAQNYSFGFAFPGIAGVIPMFFNSSNMYNTSSPSVANGPATSSANNLFFYRIEPFINRIGFDLNGIAGDAGVINIYGIPR